MARGIRVLALIVSVASILSLFAGTASATAAGFFANATWTGRFDPNDVLQVSVSPDPVMVNRVNVRFTDQFGFVCSGSTAAPPTGVITPNGFVPPESDGPGFWADPLLNRASLSNVSVPCVGDRYGSGTSIQIDSIVWREFGRLENVVGPGFVGLRRAQIAEGTIQFVGGPLARTWGDPTSTAELRLGVEPQ